jgi:voltage-gated potassium channel
LQIGEVAVIVAAVATIPVVVLDERGFDALWLRLADWAIWTVFAAVFLGGLAAAENRHAYVRRHPIDLAVILLSFPLLPSVLALTRLVRVLRLLVVAARVVPALRETLGRRELLYVASLSILLSVSAAGVLVLLEPETVGNSYAAALWWAMVTVTTVGYGDIAPSTLPGRLAAVVIMLAGLGVISTLSASIAAYFVDQEQNAGLREINERLRRIERLLEKRGQGAG